MPDVARAKRLLAATLREPFPATRRSNHVRQWTDFLAENWPLWSFQKHRYIQLEGDSWFSTEALNRIVAALLNDDGVAQRAKLTALETELDHRRYLLAAALRDNVAIPAWTTSNDELRSGPCLFCRLHFRGLRSDTYTDDDGEEVEISLYETVGYEFMRHVDGLRSSAKEERTQAEKRIIRLAKSLARQGKKGRPQKGPSQPLLRALVAEGRHLLEICWHSLSGVWPVAREPFARLGLANGDENRRWSVRLALPLLSSRELAALVAEIERADSWPKSKRGRPTPRLFAIWVLARRLNINPKSLARMTLGVAASDHFQSPNPIDD